MWNTLAGIIKDAAKDSLGMASGAARTQPTSRESWWFSEEVQSKVAAKQSCFRELLLCREGHQAELTAAEERYKIAKQEAKKAVAQAKDKAYEDLYKKFDSKEGANDIFRIAKARESRRRDLGNVKYIKDEGGQTIVIVESIRKRWGEYFSFLFNGGSTGGSGEEESPSQRPECYYSRISQPEVKVALQKMGRNKAVGPDQSGGHMDERVVKSCPCSGIRSLAIGIHVGMQPTEVVPLLQLKRVNAFTYEEVKKGTSFSATK
ncbi:hypothetical protein CTI12_AA374720 [Artemisia annua]|uniref:Uncharacterized protein n=1 Tax=Artemisia annua TaxID=35608 RepID=A0A2U1MJ07_ARTAN|nr:hypothetical protein CTI12_AA374720 [Artemisia annua]